MSPFSRGRGLKSKDVKSYNFVMKVALFTRAWIEISFLHDVWPILCVALFTRAWIEIVNVNKSDIRQIVALFTRAWIEILKYVLNWSAVICRPFHEGVDWNPFSLTENQTLPGRPFHEGVDWNMQWASETIANISRPFHEGVDWN